MATIKGEVKQEIKPDPGLSPAVVEDAYEDDFDTIIPPQYVRYANGENNGAPHSWLARIPVEMWQAWHSLYQDAKDDEHIQIGTLRVYNPAPPEEEKPGAVQNGSSKEADSAPRIQMFLDPKFEQHKAIPKEYNLDMKVGYYKNTVAFSEKDRPGQRGKTSNYSARPQGIQSKFNRYGPQKRGGAGGYRSSIPKQTELMPTIINEMNVVAVDNLDNFAKAYQAALKPKNTTVYETEINRALHPGLNQNLGFSLSSKPLKATNKRKKEQKDKAVRMEKGALFDEISKCFEQFKYWSLKALRNKLRQPEAYIKEALDEVAVLIRSGDFAMNYKLKPEFEKSTTANQSAVKDEVAPDVKGESTDQGTGDEFGGSDDDDPMDFEEVKFEGQ